MNTRNYKNGVKKMMKNTTMNKREENGSNEYDDCYEEKEAHDDADTAGIMSSYDDRIYIKV